MAAIQRVMISSTALDLPQHRKEAMDACLSRGMFPSMMEHLSASDEDAIEASLRMVEGADVYLGIFGNRYGYIPTEHDISITEMEYNHARSMGLPCLIFIADTKHAASLPTDEQDQIEHKHTQLGQLKTRLQTEQIVKFFKSPEDLRAHIINGLANFSNRKADLVEPKGFSSPIKTLMQQAQNAIDSLTQEQHQLMQSLRYQRRLAVAGCAGSGKTLVAAEKAIRLDEAGFKTLMLCHSRYLADHIRGLVAGTSVKVLDFTTWIQQLIGGAGQSGQGWNHYQEPIDQELETAFDRLVGSNERYDAIIVDEGQDFRELWWTVIEAALSSEEYGILYVFHDDNQALLPSRSKNPLMQAPIVLSKNCRNSGQVFELVRRLHPQSPETSMALKEQGIVKQWIYYSDPERTSSHSNRPDYEKVFKAAFQEAFSALNLLARDDLVVLTTEPEPVEHSILEGVRITIQPPWKWQEVVQRITGEIEGLSDEPHPTVQDVKTVQTRARELHLAGTALSSRLKYVKWQVSEDRLHLLHPYGDSRGINKLRDFFTQDDWAEGIPQPREVIISAQPQPDQVRLATISAFKGLESPGVILFVPYPFHGHPDELEASIYVGISRARYLLYMVIDKQMVSRIRAVMLPYGWD